MTDDVVEVMYNDSTNNNTQTNTEDFSVYFRTIKTYLPPTNIFSNKEFQIKSASVGLQFINTGIGFKFANFWTQYIRLESPFFREEMLTSACLK